MTAPARPDFALPTDERGAALALLPVAATLDYYALPDWLQSQPLVQFAPQLIGYLGFALWAVHNRPIGARIGLQMSHWNWGAKLGLLTGVLLGCVNTLVILRLIPSWGWDITFLKETPHAQVPVLIMVPWFISVIALLVELNFRGFLLGRLAALESIASQDVAVKANELALEGVRAENSVGTRTILDVLDAEQELLNSQVLLVTARRDAYVAGFQLLNAMGQAEAQDLGLDGGPLYDPLGNYRRVANDWNDWSTDPQHLPVFAKHFAVDSAILLAAGITDNLDHQRSAEA